MTRLLIKIFIGQGNPNLPDVRKKYGTLAGVCGIVLNLLICAVKFALGFFTGSVSITADAANNLSDAGSSVITLFGMRLSAKRSDEEHPFGHGRAEYIAGLIVSGLIVLLGFDLLINSADRIFNPTEIGFSWLSFALLVVSVLVKLWMWSFYRALGKRVSSAALLAAAADSLSDCAATLAVLAGLLCSHFLQINADGYIGIAVAAFIIVNGVRAAKSTIDPLLGSPPSPELIKGVTETVLSYDDVVGMHDLIIHDYGPSRLLLSLHAEIPSDKSLAQAHEIVDKIEKQLDCKFNCESTIHIDPVDIDDELTSSLKAQVEAAVAAIDERLTVHDFRISVFDTHTNLIFDIDLPHGFAKTDEQITAAVKSAVHDIDESYFAIVKLDRGYGG